MKLSEAEAGAIQRSRKQEEYWLRTRWSVLSVGVLMLPGSIFIFERIWSTVAYDQILLILCVLIAPASGIVLFVSVAAILYVLLFWNGRPMNKLLLRLADQVEAHGK